MYYSYGSIEKAKEVTKNKIKVLRKVRKDNACRCSECRGTKNVKPVVVKVNARKVAYNLCADCRFVFKIK